jgi:hypothetical protein
VEHQFFFALVDDYWFFLFRNMWFCSNGWDEVSSAVDIDMNIVYNF